MMNRLLLGLFCTLFGTAVSAQGANCANADPFCTDEGDAFPASTSTTAEAGPDYECLGSQPNPAWYYLQIDDPGNLTIELTNSIAEDIDFICWGPFSTLTGACSLLTSDAGCANTGTYPCGNVVDCSFLTDAVEYVNIPNAVSGEFYILMITNFSEDPMDIFANQIAGNGSTNCAIVTPCDLTGLTANPGACDANLTYDVSGSISFVNAPADGTLTVVVSNGTGTFTQTINPPFTSPAAYTISDIPGNGANTTVTVGFTSEPGCNISASYTAPLCTTLCDIFGVTALPGGCKPDNTFDLTGTFTFTESPSSGTVDVIINTPAGQYTQTFSAPFTDGQVYNYAIPNILANQPSATVTVRFSDDMSCQETIPFTTPTCICETQASFNVNPTVMTLEGTTAQMINSSTNAVSWKWLFGDGDSSNVENPSHTFPSENPGTYTIELICTSVGGCTDTARMTVVVKEDILFFVPNAFTPGNDEFNNTFEPVFTSGFDAYNYELLIYNRWGETMFESHDSTVGWDGTYKAEPLGEGVYTWVIRFKVKEDDSRGEVQGHVHLLR